MKPTEMDALLLPYLGAADEAEAQRLLAALFTEHAEPLIHKLVKRKLRFPVGGRQEERADVCSEILVQLLVRLRTLRANPREKPIADFRAYVAGMSYHNCAAYLREQYPQRWRVATRVRYLLTSQPQFGLWQNEQGEWIGGFIGWETELHTRRLFQSDQLYTLLGSALPTPLLGIPDATFRRVSAAEQIEALLTWADAFIALDDLVTVFVHWWGMQDHPLRGNGVNLQEKPDVYHNLETQLEQRNYLQKLWQEIRELPLRQRQALLLHLQCGRTQSALVLLPALQIASLRQIAAVMEMPAEELARLWNQLPLDDAHIAAQLEVTRRQVINLRLAARERLHRKTRRW